MQHIGQHMSEPSKRSKRDKVTERGEMMKYFMDRLNESRKHAKLPPLTMPRMGRLLVAIPTKDLYYLRRICDDAKDFSKKFWWEIKPKPVPTEGEGKHEKKDE